MVIETVELKLTEKQVEAIRQRNDRRRILSPAHEPRVSREFIEEVGVVDLGEID